ncbi:MAG: hypothetical protein AB8B91_05500 [Rubripirellula sp.]
MSRVLPKLFLLGFSVCIQLPTSGQESGDSIATEKTTEVVDESEDQSVREQKLAKYLSNCKFVGQFTVDGKENRTPKIEEYTIRKCEKLPGENMYRMTARIKYGDVDSEVPLEIKILWSGRTPVITLDSFWIPGMGNFGARVLIHSNRYAGTWQHDAVGGHMFGKIVQDE